MMLTLLKKLFKPQPLPTVRNKVYAQVLTQARAFCPDRFAKPSTTREDRYSKFEVIALLMAYAMWQAKNDPDAKERATLAMEAMFDDFEVNLREQGVSDMRVGPEVRKLAAAFSGRQQRYFEAFSNNKAAELEKAIAHNWKVSAAEAKALAKKLKTVNFTLVNQAKLG